MKDKNIPIRRATIGSIGRKDIVEAEGISPVFYSPGFVAQGGRIEAAAKCAGDRFHGIVGRGIYNSADMRQAAIEHTRQLRYLCSVVIT